MIDGPTQELTDSEKLNLILSRLTSVESRLAAMEEERAKDTKPLLGKMHSEIAETRADMRDGFAKTDADLSVLKDEAKRTRREVGFLREDIRNERAARAELAERVEEMEQRPS